MFKFLATSLLFITITTFSLAYADQENFDRSFQEGLKTAENNQQKANDVFKQFKAEDTFKNYSTSPSQAGYYGGVTQETTNIKNDAVDQQDNSDVVKAVKNVTENQRQIDQTALSQEIERISNKPENSPDIFTGISKEFSDCIKQQSCTTKYEKKTCEEAPDSVIQVCKNVLHVEMIPKQIDTHYSLTVHLAVKKHNYAAAVINAVTGAVNSLHPNDASVSLEGRLPANIDCNALRGKVVSEQGGSRLDRLDLPSCVNGLNLNVNISDGHSKDIVVDMIVSKTTYEPKDHWDDGCLGLAKNNSCSLQSEQCVQPAATRITQNIPVSRDCWEKESRYLCNGGEQRVGTCAPLRNDSCEQLNSVCKERNDGGCSWYLHTYRCPIKECSDTGIICNGQTYCLNGDCIKHQRQADPDFQKAVSALSASMEAAKEFDKDHQYIFSGKPKTCRNFMLGAAYCCKDEGWLVDHSLMDCNSEEKELGKAKENGTAHYVGRYEEGCVGEICAKKIKSYCEFPSKLARIIQEQGREKQLGRQFGSADHPDCSGITVEELQKIDFKNIDFKDFYDDIAKKQSIVDEKQLNQKIQDEMQHLINEKKSHHDDKK